jgi:hypothetical protein
VTVDRLKLTVTGLLRLKANTKKFASVLVTIGDAGVYCSVTAVPVSLRLIDEPVSGAPGVKPEDGRRAREEVPSEVDVTGQSALWEN